MFESKPMGTELFYVLKDVYLKATNPQILKMEKLDNFIKKKAFNIWVMLFSSTAFIYNISQLGSTFVQNYKAPFNIAVSEIQPPLKGVM